jgi:hypothetical protein
MIEHYLHTQNEKSKMAWQTHCCLSWMELEQVVLQVSGHRETHLAAFYKDNLSTNPIIKLK